MTKTICLLRTLACLSSAALPAGLRGQELIANGNFEAAGLAPWGLSAPAGSAIATVSENSPFLARYPAGSKAVSLGDDDSEFETPFFNQVFAPQSRIQYSFDFKSPAASPGSPWYVIWRGDDDTTAFFFSIGGQSGASIDLNQNTIASLEPNMWYHVEGLADAPSQSNTGAIQNSRGERTTFTSGFPFGVQTALNGVTVTDGDQGRNVTLILDNFSAHTAVIPSASLSIAPAPQGQVTVSWTTPGYTLQASSAIGSAAQWTSVTTAGQTFTTSADQPMLFFRLVAI